MRNDYRSTPPSDAALLSRLAHRSYQRVFVCSLCGASADTDGGAPCASCGDQELREPVNLIGFSDAERSYLYRQHGAQAKRPEEDQ